MAEDDSTTTHLQPIYWREALSLVNTPRQTSLIGMPMSGDRTDSAGAPRHG